MKSLFVVFSIMTVAITGWWYVYVVGLACAFSGPVGSQNCKFPMPWDMNMEDFAYIALPFLLSVAALIAAIRSAGKN